MDIKRAMTSLIDTHAHLTFPQFDEDRERVIERAWKSGLEYIITIGAGDGIKGNEAAIKLAESNKRIFATVGVHPHDAKEFKKETYEQLKNLAKNPRVVAIGEIGLDFHYDHSSHDDQIGVLKKQLELAEEVEKPVVIHDREAHEEVLKVLSEMGFPKKGLLFHCFSGDMHLARVLIDKGACISVPGIVTYKNAKSMQEVAANVSLDRLVIETDSPYLSPELHRGKRNEPSFVVEVVKKIADLKGLLFDDVAKWTTMNAKQFFGLPGRRLPSVIAYQIGRSLYLNITNHCNLACTFCPKRTDYKIAEYDLKLEHEPNVEEVFQAVGHPENYEEVVFCGFGEPTLRLELLKEIASGMKKAGAKSIRLNTDGLANLIYGRDVTTELKGLIDAVSVSLNAHNSELYAKICPSKFGKKAYGEVKKFIKCAKQNVPKVVASAIDMPEVDIDECRRIVQDELGVEFRKRSYMDVVPRSNSSCHPRALCPVE